MHLGDKELIKVYAKHDPYWNTGHLGEVVSEMKFMGPPTIKVVNWRDKFFAIEGSHRLCAAHHLGFVPKLDICYPDHYEQSDENFWDSLEQTLPHYAWLV